MKKSNLFFMLLILFVNIAFAQKDSISHIYFGVSVIPVAPVFHITEDTAWWVTKYIGGPGGNVGYCSVLSKTNCKPGFNIAAGAMFFISFNHFMDISFGVIRDMISYHQAVYLNSVLTQEKFNYYRMPVNIKFSFSKSKPIRFFYTNRGQCFWKRFQSLRRSRLWGYWSLTYIQKWNLDKFTY